MTEIKAQLKIDGNADAIDLPVYQGSTGPDVVDVRGLVSQGVFTYDPGFVSTASCESKITYIDGAAGVLLHRGYPYRATGGKIELPRDLLSYCCTANCRIRLNTTNSSIPSAITPWSTKRSTSSSGDFLAPHTPWQCCAAWLAPCRRSTMTVWTTTILNTGSKPRTA